MKKCPACAEEIQDEAVKCRFCGEVLNAGAVEAFRKGQPDAPKPSWSSRILRWPHPGLLGVLGAMLSLWGLANYPTVCRADSWALACGMLSLFPLWRGMKKTACFVGLLGVVATGVTHHQTKRYWHMDPGWNERRTEYKRLIREEAIQRGKSWTGAFWESERAADEFPDTQPVSRLISAIGGFALVMLGWPYAVWKAGKQGNLGNKASDQSSEVLPQRRRLEQVDLIGIIGAGFVFYAVCQIMIMERPLVLLSLSMPSAFVCLPLAWRGWLRTSFILGLVGLLLTAGELIVCLTDSSAGGTLNLSSCLPAALACLGFLFLLIPTLTAILSELRRKRESAVEAVGLGHLTPGIHPKEDGP